LIDPVTIEAFVSLTIPASKMTGFISRRKALVQTSRRNTVRMLEKSKIASTIMNAQAYILSDRSSEVGTKSKSEPLLVHCTVVSCVWMSLFSVRSSAKVTYQLPLLTAYSYFSRKKVFLCTLPRASVRSYALRMFVCST
jgi:hypothetical protein